MRLRTEVEVLINHDYKDMSDILDCIEEDIEEAVEEAVGKRLEHMLGNTSNVVCNVTSSERIRDNIRMVFNLDNKETLERITRLIEYMKEVKSPLDEQYIFDTFKASFDSYFNMHLAMLENIVKEKENQK